MSTVAQIRAAIAAQVAAVIPDLHVYDRHPGVINPDCAVVRRLGTDWHADFDDSETARYGVTLYLAWGSLEDAQDSLDAYLSRTGARSVKAALEAGSSTLGGVVHGFSVTGVDEEGLIEHGAVDYLTATVNLLVLA